jgi:hypothetical protein
MGIYVPFVFKWSFNFSLVLLCMISFLCMISGFEVKKEGGQVYDTVLNGKMEGYDM